MNTFNNIDIDIDIVTVEDFLESMMKESDDSNCIDLEEATTEQKSSFHEDNCYKFYDKNSIINIPSIRLDGTT
jgi:Mg2+/Co2+ transporter CorB